MMTEIDAGHVIYRDLEILDSDGYGLERRLKGHLHTGRLDGESPMVGESVPDEGMVVIIPKSMSADRTYFNGCTIEVNILMRDIEDETNPKMNLLLKEALKVLQADKTGCFEGTWYRYSVRSHGIEQESGLHCHYANITIDFETLNVR